MKKNPKDATLRNTQAANKKIAKLAEKLKALTVRVKALEKRKS